MGIDGTRGRALTLPVGLPQCGAIISPHPNQVHLQFMGTNRLGMA